MPIMCSIYFLCTLLYSCTIYYSYYCILFWLFLICMKIILTNIPIISKTRNIARAYGSKSSTVHNYCCTIEIDYTILYTNFSVYVCKHIYTYIIQAISTTTTTTRCFSKILYTRFSFSTQTAKCLNTLKLTEAEKQPIL